MPRRAWILLVATAVIWGSSFLFIKVAVEGMHPMLLVGLRCALGAAVCWPIIRVLDARPGRTPRGPYTRREIWSLGVVGAMTGLPFLLIAWGETHVDSAVAGISNAATPLWATLLAVRWDVQHRGSTRRTTGVVVGFVGVALLLVAHSGLGGGEGTPWAAAALGFAGLGYAIGGVVTRSNLLEVDASRVAAWSVTIPAVVMLVPGVILQRPETPTAGAIASAVVLGVFGTGIALLLYYHLLHSVGVSRASMVTYLMPPLAVMYGWALLGEQISVVEIASMSIILAGVWIGSTGADVSARE